MEEEESAEEEVAVAEPSEDEEEEVVETAEEVSGRKSEPIMTRCLFLFVRLPGCLSLTFSRCMSIL